MSLWFGGHGGAERRLYAAVVIVLEDQNCSGGLLYRAESNQLEAGDQIYRGSHF
jgi:hypothetical protein